MDRGDEDAVEGTDEDQTTTSLNAEGMSRASDTQAIGAITHRLCRLIWKMLHQGIRYEERCVRVGCSLERVSEGV